jgi:16S rRNA (adenine1518-N6/adenine1519-N6)-dimethyltransferase
MVMGRYPPAKRSLGQNFLVDANIQRKIVDALGAGPTDEVVEIGPGRGALTRHLVGRVGRLVLVELDDYLATELAAAYDGRDDVRVIRADILDVPIQELTSEGRRAEDLLVLGNIPYNITTPILFHLLERPRPKEIVLMVQDDVAARIVAPVGTKEYGALSVGVRTVAEVERLFKVGRKAFRPVPGVDSAMIRVRPLQPPSISEPDEEALRRLVRAAFQWRRKQVGKILRDHQDLGYEPDAVAGALDKIGAAPTDRPERLSPAQFVALSAALPGIRPAPNL